MKKQSASSMSAMSKELEMQNSRAQWKLEQLKMHLAESRPSPAAQEDGAQDDYLSAPLYKSSVGRRQYARQLQSFPDEHSAKPPAKASQSKTGKNPPKKVKLTFLVDEPLDLPKRDTSTVPLSQKLMDADRGRSMGKSPQKRMVKTTKTSTSTDTDTLHASSATLIICGQCETTKGSKKCLDCKEVYCSLCFSKFHQKGALKSHKSEAVQALQPLSTNSGSHQTMSSQYRHGDQLSAAIGSIKPVVQPTSTSNSNPCSSNSGSGALWGEYDEAAQARSFQEALMEWRAGRQADSSSKLSEATSTAGGAKSKHPSTQTHGTSSAATSATGSGQGSLWGEYDEEAGAADFARALQDWRDGRKPTTSSSGPTVSTVERKSTGTSSEQVQRKSQKQIEFSFGPSPLSYTERLLLQKHREGKLYGRPASGVISVASVYSGQQSTTSLDENSSSPAIEVPESGLSATPTPVLTSMMVGRQPVSSSPPSHTGELNSCDDRQGDSTDVQTEETRSADTPVGATTSSSHECAQKRNYPMVEDDGPTYTGLEAFFLAGVDQKSGEALKRPQISASAFSEPVELMLNMERMWIPENSTPDIPSTVDVVTSTDDYGDDVVPGSELQSSLPRSLPMTTSDGAALAENDELEFVQGDLQIVDVDSGEECDEEERCLTELARELATAHGLREPNTQAALLDIPVQDFVDQWKEMEMTSDVVQLQETLEAKFDAFRKELDDLDSTK